MNRLYIIALAAIGIMCALALVFNPTPAAEPVKVEKTAKKDADEPKALVLNRDGSGQFTMSAEINGSSVEFLVDTGADMVALTVEEAEGLGILPPDEEFVPSMKTASGVGYGAPVILDEVVIAGQTLHDVEAVVVKDLGTNLLGQSVLRQLGSVELKGDRMVIKTK